MISFLRNIKKNANNTIQRESDSLLNIRTFSQKHNTSYFIQDDKNSLTGVIHICFNCFIEALQMLSDGLNEHWKYIGKSKSSIDKHFTKKLVSGLNIEIKMDANLRETAPPLE